MFFLNPAETLFMQSALIFTAKIRDDRFAKLAEILKWALKMFIVDMVSAHLTRHS